MMFFPPILLGGSSSGIVTTFAHGIIVTITTADHCLMARIPNILATLAITDVLTVATVDLTTSISIVTVIARSTVRTFHTIATAVILVATLANARIGTTTAACSTTDSGIVVAGVARITATTVPATLVSSPATIVSIAGALTVSTVAGVSIAIVALSTVMALIDLATHSKVATSSLMAWILAVTFRGIVTRCICCCIKIFDFTFIHQSLRNLSIG